MADSPQTIIDAAEFALAQLHGGHAIPTGTLAVLCTAVGESCEFLRRHPFSGFVAVASTPATRNAAVLYLLRFIEERTP